MGSRIVVIDDSQMFRSLLSGWVRSQSDLDFVAEFGDPLGFKAADIRRGLRADAFIVGNLAVSRDSVEQLSAISRVGENPPCLVGLVDTVRAEELAHLQTTFTSGWALLSRHRNDADQLRQGLDAALAGLVLVDPNVGAPLPGSSHPWGLTDQEWTVLKALAEGKSNQVISQLTFLSLKTVERVVGTVYEKLGLNREAKGTNPRVLAALRFHHLG